MQSDRPRQENEEFSVRLSWPKGGAAPAPEEAEADPPAPDAPGGPPVSPPPAAEAPGPRPAHRATPAAAAEATISSKAAKAAPSAPASKLSRPAPATAGATPSAVAKVTEVVSAGGDTSRMGKVFVEAFDRLADRLLERLRGLRQDVDADLGAVRAELASLRQAVDDVGDRVQLRQLRTTLDELKSDVTGLRRAVLEWPELEQVSSDIAAVRGDLSLIFEGMSEGGGGQGPSELLSELQRVVADLGAEARRVGGDTGGAALAPLLEEVAAMRSELTSIRKRMVLRASPIDDEQLERIVSAVAERVTEELQAGEGRRSRRK